MFKKNHKVERNPLVIKITTAAFLLDYTKVDEKTCKFNFCEEG